MTLAAPARRIVTLYAGFDEILADLGLTQRIIARTSSDIAVPHLDSLPTVGTHLRPNVELILGAKPDMVVQLGGREASLGAAQELRQRGVNVAILRIASFADLFEAYRRLGLLTGEEARAGAAVAAMQSRLDAVSRRVAGRPRPRVMAEVRFPPLLVASAASMTGEIVRLAGGIMTPQASQAHQPLGLEALIALAPDAYVVLSGPMNPSPEPPATRDVFRDLPAVRQGRVLFADWMTFSRGGPRNVEAVERLAAFLHPDSETTTEAGAPQ